MARAAILEEQTESLATTLNLVTQPGLTVSTEDGTRVISPCEITIPRSEGGPIRLASPRPDFDGAAVQFLIGLVQASPLAARAGTKWRTLYDEPPTSDELKEAFAGLEDYFELFGEGPRAFQDHDPLLDGTQNPIEKLLIDHGLSAGSDLFVRSGEIHGLCQPCAALALISLQASAPSGGRGHRTSMRGGGPLTTLVIPPDLETSSTPLWRLVWLNVVHTNELDSKTPLRTEPELRFPWLGPTRTSEGGRTTLPSEVDPLQAYFATPRRVRLENPSDSGTCSVCGREGPLVTHFRTRNYGVSYSQWLHPLTPYVQTTGSTDEPWASRKGNANGMGYRQWLGLALGGREELRSAVPVRIYHLTPNRRRLGDLRIWAFGFAMDNMKPKAWAEGTVPLLTIPADVENEEETQILIEELAAEATRLIDGAGFASSALRRAIKTLLSKRPENVGEPNEAITAFWSGTEASFFEHIVRLRDAVVARADMVPVKRSWHRHLRQTCEALFGQKIGVADFRVLDPRQVADAWHALVRTLNGKKIHTALGLEKPSRAQSVPQEKGA